MGRATVRQAVADWFAPPAVPGLNNVFRSEPKLIQGEDYGIDAYGIGPADFSGALAFVFIEEERETRIAMGGATSGKKHITYQVALVVLFRSVNPDAVAAMDDYDTLIDNIKARLRANRTLGQDGSIIWQAGENTDDIHVQSDLPKQDEESVYVWSAVDFTVVEEINS